MTSEDSDTAFLRLLWSVRLPVIEFSSIEEKQVRHIPKQPQVSPLESARTPFRRALSRIFSRKFPGRPSQRSHLLPESEAVKSSQHEAASRHEPSAFVKKMYN